MAILAMLFLALLILIVAWVLSQNANERSSDMVREYEEAREEEPIYEDEIEQ